jgi:hypothetical protein
MEALVDWSEEQFRAARWSGFDPSVGPPPNCYGERLLRFKSRRNILKAAYHVMWADPYSLPMDQSEPHDGFFYKGDSEEHDPRVLYFTLKAATEFLELHGFQRILRGHQGKRTGVEWSLFYKVMTIFSDSCDHFKTRNTAGDEVRYRATLCGCVLVDNNAIRCIILQPAASNTK